MPRQGVRIQSGKLPPRVDRRDRRRRDDGLAGSGSAGDEHAPAQQRTSFAQRVEGRQPGNREGRGAFERDRRGEHREVAGRHGEPFGPGAFVQHPDDPRAGVGAAAVGRGALERSGEIPAGSPAVGVVLRAPHLAQVEADRGDPHQRLGRQGRRIGDRGELQPARRGAVDDDGLHVAYNSPRA